jgi:hypothetical protein
LLPGAFQGSSWVFSCRLPGAGENSLTENRWKEKGGFKLYLKFGSEVISEN